MAGSDEGTAGSSGTGAVCGVRSAGAVAEDRAVVFAVLEEITGGAIGEPRKDEKSA